MSATIFASTECKPHTGYQQYLHVGKDEKDRVIFTLRGKQTRDGLAGETVSIEIPHHELILMARALLGAL